MVAAAPGQFVPLARHTDCPAITRLEPEALVKARFVVVTPVAVKDERERGEEMVRLPIVALFAKRLVLVTVVPVSVVNVPAAGVEPPITILLIVPPDSVTLEDESDPIDAMLVFRVVPEAVAKPNQEVEVPLVKERLEIVPFVIVPFVAKRLVVVTEVPVALVNVVAWREDAPCTVKEEERTNAPVDVPPAKEMA